MDQSKPQNKGQATLFFTEDTLWSDHCLKLNKLSTKRSLFMLFSGEGSFAGIKFSDGSGRPKYIFLF